MPKLTIERLFSEPDLSGPSPSRIRISPDGTRVAFLRASEEDRLKYDLWEFDLDERRARVLVKATDLDSGTEQISAEEQARRERQRIAALTGIVDYHFSSDGKSLLFPLNGDLYLHRIDSGKTAQLTSSDSAEIDPKFSPLGGYVSFVRDRDLYTIDLETLKEFRLTNATSGQISNGSAEFIAQEEMDRSTGYWWAPDDSAIAYLQTDESQVEIQQRFEVHAESTRIIEQRYPATGSANVTYKLGVVGPREAATHWLDLGANDDIYIPRVDWFPDSRHLAVQRQSRNQQRLELIRYDTKGESVETLLTETSNTWIDIFDDLTFLAKRKQFIWPSARDSYKHFYLYDYDGNLIRQLTAGDWEVTGDRNRRALLHVDEDSGEFFFMATAQSPIERHLYRSSLDETRVSTPKKISSDAGWHNIVVSKQGSFFVDTFSSSTRPPTVSVNRMDGERIGFVEENALDENHAYAPYAANHAPAEFGELRANDGQTLHYYLRRPTVRSDTPLPAIVIVYGGPHGQRVKNDWSSLFEQVLVQNGYVVFSLDNRGTDFRGSAFDDPIYAKLGQLEPLDQKVGVEHLGSLPFVDAQRIGIFGWSYGGYMTLMCMLQTPELYAAGVSGAPVTDWALYDTHYTERYLSTPAANPEGYEKGSVFPYVSQLNAPLLLMHGMADDNVLFSNSTKLMQALQHEGKLFELMTYPGSKHGLLRSRREGTHAYRSILDFFDRQLKDSGGSERR